MERVGKGSIRRGLPRSGSRSRVEVVVEASTDHQLGPTRRTSDLPIIPHILLGFRTCPPVSIARYPPKILPLHRLELVPVLSLRRAHRQSQTQVPKALAPHYAIPPSESARACPASRLGHEHASAMSPRIRRGRDGWLAVMGWSRVVFVRVPLLSLGRVQDLLMRVRSDLSGW